MSSQKPKFLSRMSGFLAFCVVVLIIQMTNVYTRVDGISNVFLTKFNIYSEMCLMFAACAGSFVGCLLIRFSSKTFSYSVNDYTNVGIVLSFIGCGIGMVAFPLLMKNINEGRYVSIEQTITDIGKMTATKFDYETQTFTELDEKPSLSRKELAQGLYESTAASQMRFSKNLFLFNNLVGLLGFLSILCLIFASRAHMRALKVTRAALP